MPDERRTQHATLGCGTLILIALIVMFFSGGHGTADLEQDVRALRSVVADLKKAVDAQTSEMKRLHKRLDQLQPGKAEDAKGRK